MPQTTHNGITLEYETHGDPANPPLLLIMGSARSSRCGRSSRSRRWLNADTT